MLKGQSEQSGCPFFLRTQDAGHRTQDIGHETASLLDMRPLRFETLEMSAEATALRSFIIQHSSFNFELQPNPSIFTKNTPLTINN